jgi:hypothetical protein
MLFILNLKAILLIILKRASRSNHGIIEMTEHISYLGLSLVQLTEKEETARYDEIQLHAHIQ